MESNAFQGLIIKFRISYNYFLYLDKEIPLSDIQFTPIYLRYLIVVSTS